MLKLAGGARSLTELVEISRSTNCTKFRDQGLGLLLAAGLDELRVPENSGSTKQRDRTITPRGAAVATAAEA